MLTNKYLHSKRTSSAGMMVMLYCADKHILFYKRQRRIYTSRWKLILQDNSALHTRLYNSLDFLQGTNLALYAINKATLVSHSMFFKVQIVVLNSYKVVHARMRRKGRRFRHRCRVWGCVLRLCVLERISSSSEPTSFSPPPVPSHHNTESESSSGQEGSRADTSTNMGP